MPGAYIMLQGANASNSAVTFDSMMSGVKVSPKANPKKEIMLNAPMNTYSPIYPQTESSDKPALFGNIDGHYILSGLKKAFSGRKTINLFVLGLFGLIFLVGAKLIKGKDNEISVGLSKGLRDRDLAYTKDAVNFTPGYKPSERKPYTTSNYGLKAYQSSTQSPYLNHHTAMSDEPLVNRMPKSAPTMQRRSIQQTRPSTMTQPKIQPKTVDSVKFLESMSAIYEKSGRPDLANGIRTKLQKMSK